MRTRAFSAAARPLPLAIMAMTALLGCKSINLVHAATALLDVAAGTPEESHSSAPRERVKSSGAVSTASPGLQPMLRPSPAVISQRGPMVAASIKTNSEPTPATVDTELAGELARQRNAIDGREERSNAGSELLATAQAKLQQQLRALDDQQKQLGAAERKRLEQDASTWANLAKMYEVMPSKNAASIFDVIDPHVLLKIMEHMDVRKAAAVMAAMGPDRARLATQMLAAQKVAVTIAAPPTQASPIASAERE